MNLEDKFIHTFQLHGKIMELLAQFDPQKTR